MRNPDIAIVPATPQMFHEFTGEVPKVTLRAVAAVCGDRIVGIAGVYVDKAHARQAMFSHLSDDLRKDRRTIVRGIRAMLRLASLVKLPVHAVLDENIEGAERLLIHMGFVKSLNGVYVWHI